METRQVVFLAEERNTQDLLVASFKSLMMKIPFKKITIKKITDGAGVIRPTFYNYFSDKFMIFEQILDQELFTTLYSLVEINMTTEIIPVIFAYFNKNKNFYKKAFNIEGQPNFTSILSNKIENFAIYLLQELPLQDEEAIQTLGRENVAKFYTNGLVQVLYHYCHNLNDDYDIDFYIHAYTYLASHSLTDIFEIPLE